MVSRSNGDNLRYTSIMVPLQEMCLNMFECMRPVDQTSNQAEMIKCELHKIKSDEG